MKYFEKPMLNVDFGSLTRREINQVVYGQNSSDLQKTGTTETKVNDTNSGKKAWNSLFQNTGKSSTKELPSNENTLSKPRENVISYQGIQPRGLINSGNMCFMNAILQPLVFCDAFHKILRNISSQIAFDLTDTKNSILESMLMFLGEFRVLTETEFAKEGSIEKLFGTPFSPEYVYNSLSVSGFGPSGNQEDAEEFLGFILNGLSEEIVKKTTALSNEDDRQGSSDQWTEIGTNSKKVRIRKTESSETALTKLFCGNFRSILRVSGRDSVMLEPFQFVPLDIASDSVRTVNDALELLCHPERIDEFGSGGGKAVKQMFFETLPEILILHIKRFVYCSHQGSQKLSKFLEYPRQLAVNQDLMSNAAKGQGVQTFELFSVINHHGKQASGGHYTCDVCWECKDAWLRIDDASIQTVSIDDVLYGSQGTAYLLFYQRR